MEGLLCPICEEPLDLANQAKSLKCENDHLFDIAKQGYVNLLTNKHKTSKQPGDSAEMVSARASFLDQGYYSCIADGFIESAQPYCAGKDFHYLDIGCGDGYYTQQLDSSFDKPHCSSGLDISQPAIKSATKRTKDIQWLVGNAFHLPVQNDSQDLVSALFCRISYEEISRVLKLGGYLIVTTTGSNHLKELRELIYDEVKDEKYLLPTEPTKDLIRVARTQVGTSIKVIGNDSVKNLLLMTPHYWRVKKDKKAIIERLEELNVTIDVNFTCFQKH